MSDPSAPQPHREGAGSARPDPEGERLQQELEQRLARGADPIDALADLLSGRSTDEHVLLGMQGETLGGYRLVAVIGRGGMGVTWLGRDAAGNEAAVKVVTGLHGTAGERFDNECRILKSLQHEAIVHYLGHGVLGDGRGFLVMEHVRGVDLEVLLDDAIESDPRTPAAELLLEGFEARGPLVLHQGPYQRRILRLLATVADALHHAHQQGIVHRDLKPANVLVSTALEPTLIDFGLSRDAMQKVSLSRSGQALGTLAYMAPEQFGRDPGNVSPRTDIYALGLMLYRAMTGKELRADMHDLMQRAKQPFLLDARTSRSMPVDVQAILYRCLDARPERRYQDAHQLALDLRAAAAHGTVSVRRPSLLELHLRSPLGRWSRVAAVACVAAVGLYLSWPSVPYALAIHALDPTIAVQLNGGEPLSPHRGSLPLEGPGKHEVAVRIGPRVVDRITIDVQEEQHTTVVPLLHTYVHLGPGGRLANSSPFVQVRDHDAPAPSWVQFLTGDLFLATAESRSIDGSPMPLFQSERQFWLQEPAGTVRELSARHGVLQESITFTTQPNQVHDVVLLPKQLLHVPGKYRRTLATVHSPLPEGLALRLQGAVAHLERNTQDLSKIADFLPMAMACLTPLKASQQPALAIADISFPERIRSISVMFRSGADRDGDVQLSYRLDELPEVRIGSGQLLANSLALPDAEVLEIGVGDPGCRRFRLIARMNSLHDHAEGVAVRHLASFVCGGHVESDPACLAVVADPEPISWFSQPAPETGSHRRTRWNALPVAKIPAVTLAERHLTNLPRGSLPGGMVLEPGRTNPRGLDAVIAMSPAFSAAHQATGHFHRVDVQTGANADPVSSEALAVAKQILLSVADADGDRQRDFLIGDSRHSDQGYHSGRVLLVSSGTGSVVSSWQLPPVGSLTPHFLFGEVVQPIQSHATDTLFLTDARGYPGGEAKRGSILLLDTRSKAVLARLDGMDAVPDIGINLVPILDPVDLDSDRLLEFATLRPLGMRVGRDPPPCVLEIWSGDSLLQLQGTSPRVVGSPEVSPLYRFYFEARSPWANGTWIQDIDGDGQPELFIVFYPDNPPGCLAILTMISLPRGVIWEHRIRQGPDDVNGAEESWIRQALAVADLNGDSLGDLALLAALPGGIRLLFVSSADGTMLGEQVLMNDFRGANGTLEMDRVQMLQIPDLDGDGFGQLLVPRVQQGPDGQPQCTLMLYDLKRLR